MMLLAAAAACMQFALQVPAVRSGVSPSLSLLATLGLRAVGPGPAAMERALRGKVRLATSTSPLYTPALTLPLPSTPSLYTPALSGLFELRVPCEVLGALSPCTRPPDALMCQRIPGAVPYIASGECSEIRWKLQRSCAPPPRGRWRRFPTQHSTGSHMRYGPRLQLLVVAAAELRRCALGWLKRLPSVLRTGAAPEPCFVSWPTHLPTAAPCSTTKPASAAVSASRPSVPACASRIGVLGSSPAVRAVPHSALERSRKAGGAMVFVSGRRRADARLACSRGGGGGGGRGSGRGGGG
jgi:hypothetical protein